MKKGGYAIVKVNRFNLSILECKSVPVRRLLHAVFVLIYPYWNVNLIAMIESIIASARFNLSILECK